MAEGIKHSKVVIMDVRGKFGPESDIEYDENGKHSKMPPGYDDFYIVGLGLKPLYLATHDPVFGYEVSCCNEMETLLDVYLQDDQERSLKYPVGNRKMDKYTGEFSKACEAITDDDCDDLVMHAKGTQYCGVYYDYFEESVDEAEVTAGTQIFTGSFGGGGDIPSYSAAYTSVSAGGLNSGYPSTSPNGAGWKGCVCPNCTGYAEGRGIEMGKRVATKDDTTAATGDTSVYWTSHYDMGEHSSTPNVGAGVIFSRHVAIVERIEGDRIFCSGSNGSLLPTKDEGYYNINDSRILGFIRF